MASLRELPDIETFEDAGLLERPVTEIGLDGVLGLTDGDAVVDEIEFEDTV